MSREATPPASGTAPWTRRRLLRQGGLLAAGATLWPNRALAGCPEPAPCTDTSGWTVELLRDHLQAAVELELATIPLYLTALYSIKDPNSDAYRQIRSVVIEEMLHLQLASNLLLAAGGSPRLTGSAAPVYPTPIPARTEGEDVLVVTEPFPRGGDPHAWIADAVAPTRVTLGPATRRRLEGFVAIEVPTAIDPSLPGHLDDQPVAMTLPPYDGGISCEPQPRYHTIGQFYEAIAGGLRQLDSDGRLFFRAPDLQVTAYGRDDVRVVDLDSALRAIHVITDQGEGACRRPYEDLDGQSSHYGRFLDILERRMDQIEGDAVWPMIEDPGGVDLASLDPSLDGLSAFFDAAYSWTLIQLEAGLNGDGALVSQAIGGLMFQVVKPLAIDLMQRPIQGDARGRTAGPRFLYAATSLADLQARWEALAPDFRADPTILRAAAAMGLEVTS